MIPRRAIGVLVASVPVALIAASFMSSWTPRLPRAGVVIAILALAFAAMNAYVSFIRPTLFPRRKGYRNVSVAPLVGNVLVIAAVLVAFGSPLVAALAAIAYVLDTGGVPWFVIATWRDDSLWNA